MYPLNTLIKINIIHIKPQYIYIIKHNRYMPKTRCEQAPYKNLYMGFCSNQGGWVRLFL